jgi:hypothetical protein
MDKEVGSLSEIEDTILSQAIKDEQLAIKDHVLFASAGAVISVLLLVLIPLLAGKIFNKNQVILAALSPSGGIIVGLLSVPQPTKEILERRDNIRYLQAVRSIYRESIDAEKREHCLKMIRELYSKEE